MVYPIADAKRRFSELVKRAAYGKEVIEVGTRGRAEVALVSLEELERLRELERESDARRLEQAIRTTPGLVPLAQLARGKRKHPR